MSIQRIFSTEYCDVRLKFYTERKKYMINEMEIDLKKINEMIRFITYVCDPDHELKAKKRRKQDLITLLEKYQFLKFAKKTKRPNGKTDADDDTDAGAGAPDTDDTDDTDEDTTDHKGLSYDYLLSMPFYSLTEERIKKLMKELEHIQTKLDTLKSTTIQTLWTETYTRSKVN